MVGRKGRLGRRAAVAETEVAEVEPKASVSQSVIRPTVQVTLARKPFKLAPLGLAVVLGRFGLLLGMINNDGVSALVHPLCDESLGELGGRLRSRVLTPRSGRSCFRATKSQSPNVVILHWTNSA